MICSIVQRWIPAYTANELSSLRCWFVEGHVANCERCAAEVEKYYRMSDWLAVARRTSAPDCSVSWDTVRARISQTALQPARPQRAWWPLIPVALGAAMFLLFHGMEKETPKIASTPNKPSKVVSSEVVPTIKVPSIPFFQPSKDEEKDSSDSSANDKSDEPVRHHLRAHPHPAMHHAMRKTQDPFVPLKSNKSEHKARFFDVALHDRSRHDNGGTTAGGSTGHSKKVTEINVDNSSPGGDAEGWEHDSGDIHWAY